MSKISEFFGLNCKDESLDFEAAMNTQICPYTQRVCTKMRKSDPDIKIGTCSVQYQHQDVIICPYRLLEHNQIFIDCLHFLIVFEIHILDLIDGLLVSVMKKLISVAPIVTKYWDFCI